MKAYAGVKMEKMGKMCLKYEKVFFILSLLVGIMEAAPLTSTQTSQQNKLTQAATKSNFQWTPRMVWHALPARHITPINSAVRDVHDDADGSTAAATVSSSGVPYVIIHHTATRRCVTGTTTPTTTTTSTTIEGNSNSQSCHIILRAIQHSHQADRGWDDIGYNFLIGGGDGHDNAEIYEGRGFNVSGAHTIGYNGRSIGIALIGNWTDTLPPESMLKKLQELINFGVEAGFIKSNYKLLGHRQLSATECPGTRFYNELKNWPHFKGSP